MSWEILMSTSRYHTQDIGNYCGAATAMMILAEIGVPYTALAQDDLYASNHNNNSHSSGWSTDAEGLQYTLNHRKPATHPGFIVAKALTQEQGTRNLLWTLINWGTSPGALVFGGGHWNVVCGARADHDPKLGNYTIEGFYHQNPVYYSPPPPPPHDGSDTCGSGGSHGLGWQFKTYNDWLSNWFTGFYYDVPSGNKQWVSVDDPATPEIDAPKLRPPTKYADGTRLITSQQATKFAEMGLKEYRLAESGPLGEILRGGRAGEAMVVHRLDRPGRYYHLVSWVRNNEIVGFVTLDSESGMFNGFSEYRITKKTPLITNLTNKNVRAAIAKRIEGKEFKMPGRQNVITVHPGTYGILPVLVWTPCRESWSPELPFYMITLGSYRLYLRIDGRVFTRLTTNVRGG